LRELPNEPSNDPQVSATEMNREEHAMNRVRTASILLVPLLALAALVGASASAGPAAGGEDPLAPLPGSLDELLASALRRNPEILVEEARVREAQANLNQARLAVTQAVVRLHFERQEQQRVLAGRHQELIRHRALHQSGQLGAGEMESIEIEIAQTEGEIARIDAELRYAIGHGGTLPEAELLADPRGAGAAASLHVEPRVVPAPVPEPILTALDRAMLTAEFQETPIEDVLDLLANATGLEFILGPSLRDQSMTLTLKIRGQTSARKLIHAIADQVEVEFVVRSYGILAEWAGEAPDSAAILPPREE
jgi:hypothetical protein